MGANVRTGGIFKGAYEHGHGKLNANARTHLGALGLLESIRNGAPGGILSGELTEGPKGF